MTRHRLPLACVLVLGCGGTAEDETPPPFMGTELCENEGVSIAPSGRAFGRLIAGTERTLEATLEYQGCEPARLEFGLQNLAETCDGSTAFCLDDALPAAVQPGEEIPISIRFTPDAEGSALGSLSVSGCPNRRCMADLVLQGRGELDAIVCFPDLVDFGAVRTGDCSSAEVVCSNVVDRPTTLESLSLSSSEFEANASMPMDLTPGESATLSLTYCPVDDGSDSAQLGITSSVEGMAATSSITLSARSGGGRLDLPQLVDFGEVSLIAPARRPFLVTNAGHEPLDVTDILVDVPFTTVIRSAASLDPGEQALLWVQAEPILEGRTSGPGRLVTDDPVTPFREMELAVTGVNLPPCDALLSPEELDFGSVTLGEVGRASIDVQNVGPTECLVTGAFVVDPRSPFQPADVISSLRVPAGESATIEIQFTPTSSMTPARGTLEVGLSDPGTPFVRVPLTGSGN